MKKLLLCASVLSLSLGLAKAQTPGKFPTYVYDDFQQTAQYENTDGTGGIYWYSGNATAVNATRVVGNSTFQYANAAAGVTYLSADFGTDPGPLAGSADDTPLSINLTTMSDIEVDLKNTSTTSDLQLRVYLKDVNGKYLEIEPNVSDCVGVPDFATANSGAMWTDLNLVYPAPANYPADVAVYPRVAYNGFIIPSNTRKKYRIDLSSVSTAKGGRFAGTYTGGSPINSPQSSAPNSTTFDITKVHVVEFVFNEDTPFTLSDGALNVSSYQYDAEGISQSDYTGSIVFYSFKVGSVLTPLTTGIVTDAAVDGSLKAYPNPAKETLNVSFEATSNATVSLTDIVGNTLYTTAATAGENEIKINTSSFTKGMYILTVSTEKGKATRKVSIQ
jgi:Secretion system C-terminal sorting domain